MSEKLADEKMGEFFPAALEPLRSLRRAAMCTFSSERSNIHCGNVRGLLAVHWLCIALAAGEHSPQLRPKA